MVLPVEKGCVIQTLNYSYGFHSTTLTSKQHLLLYHAAIENSGVAEAAVPWHRSSIQIGYYVFSVQRSHLDLYHSPRGVLPHPPRPAESSCPFFSRHNNCYYLSDWPVFIVGFTHCSPSLICVCPFGRHRAIHRTALCLYPYNLLRMIVPGEPPVKAHIKACDAPDHSVWCDSTRSPRYSLTFV